MPFKPRKKYPIRSIKIKKSRAYSVLSFEMIIETEKRDKDMQSGYRTITRPLQLFLNDKLWDHFAGY